jgi:predicted TIM-barrel fold metal-dependent hydrolase
MFGDELTKPWVDQLREQAPGIELFDVHTHIGQNDPDGYKCTAEELTGGLVAADARSAVFAMHEPDGYPTANDAAIAAAAESDGRMVAFARLDPRADPLGEAERCLAAGAAGIKFHPRAEAFPLDIPELEGVFSLADERGLPVLVHAGRGIPALGRHAIAICERHPNLRLILAHCGICDLSWIWREAPNHPNLFFDTSWWSPDDLLTLFTHVPPGQILFASDAPYGTPLFAASLHLRYALQAGLSEEQLRTSFGAQSARLVAGEEPLDAGPPVGIEGLARDPLLDRIHTFLVSSIGQSFNTVDPVETVQLAQLSCDVADDAPQAEVCAAVLKLLELRERLNASGVSDGRPPRFAPGLPFLMVAAALVRTPSVPMPPL